MSETNTKPVTLAEHMRKARAAVKPENCRRTREQCAKAANVRWNAARVRIKDVAQSVGRQGAVE